MRLARVLVSVGRPLNTVVSHSMERAPRGNALSIRARFDLVFDALLFVAFGVAYTLDFTGLPVHEWFGLAFGMALIVHLTLHWEWVVRTTKRFSATTGRRRIMWLINLMLLLAMTLCVASGIMISVDAIPSLGIATSETSGYWRALHVRTAELAIPLIAAHVALDWRWVVTVTRRMVRSGHGQPRALERARVE